MKFPGGRIVLIFGVILLTQIDHVKSGAAKQREANCGDVITGQRIVDLKSPGYPSVAKGDLSCLIKVDLLKDNVATRVDFIQAEMEGLSFTVGDAKGHCESDFVLFRGFEDWAPPTHCGNLTGYSFLIGVIDRHLHTPQTKNLKNLTIHALMASRSYPWHIRVVQVLRGKISSSNHQSSRSKNRKRNTKHNSTNFDVTPSKPEPKFVFNGEDTVIAKVPWQVSFRVNRNSEEAYNSTNEELGGNCSFHEGSHFCGGSIIGESLLLTASHCFYGTSKQKDMTDLSTVKAVVGDTNLCRDEESAAPSFDYDIESVTMHYACDSHLLNNDIAVVKLKNKIEFKDHIKPIQLAEPGDDYSDTVALLSGWGTYFKPNREVGPSSPNNTNAEDMATLSQILNEIITSTTPTPTTSPPDNMTLTTSTTPRPGSRPLQPQIPSILQSSMDFLIANKTICNAIESIRRGAGVEEVLKYVKYYSVFDSKLCILLIRDLASILDGNAKPASAGSGDSGGPLVVYQSHRGDKEPVQVGVVSFGSPDNSHGFLRFDSFSSVPFYRSWIDLAVLSHEVA